MLEQTVSSVEYRGGDDSSVFPIPFPFLDNSHVEATVRQTGGIDTRLRAGIDFTINRLSDANGEFVLLGAPLAEGAVLTLRRVVPLTQEILFHNQGPNSPRAAEEALDKLTMIAQQHEEALARRLAAPDGDDPEKIVQSLLAGSEACEALGEDLAAVRQGLADKADKQHRHSMAQIDDLPAAIAAKADAAAVNSALSGKANAGDLAGKADIGHTHAIAAVSGLAAALAGKLDTDDARLANLAGKIHAASHARDGSDPLSPAAIGALAIPPGDGKSYIATAGGWVEYVAPASTGEGEAGGTLDHAQLLNRAAADQHPQSAIQHLSGDLDAIRSDIASVESAAAAAGAAASANGARLSGLETSALPDAPSDDQFYARKNGGWEPLPDNGGSAGGNAGTGVWPGEIRLLPFRSAELPSGWYFCNGDRFSLSSPQGTALSALSSAFKNDWGIAAAAGTIGLPNLFAGANGYFLRPVNNANRLPGTAQGDAIRNITGTAQAYTGTAVGLISRHATMGGLIGGAFVRGADTTHTVNYTTVIGSQLGFDASAAVPTAEENRPINIGMTPAIYLGV